MLARETEFFTNRGIKSFADFKNGDSVSILTHVDRWQKAKVRSYGKQFLNKITFGRDYVVFATKDHRWLVDGWTTDLKVGDKILQSKFYADFGWTVSDIAVNFKEEEVWCLEVENDHSFVLLHGIVTGNCSFYVDKEI